MIKVPLLLHQRALYSAPWNPQTADKEYFFLTAGYASGKTFGDVGLIVNMIRRYARHDITIGVFGTSLIFLKKTLLLELYRMLDRQGIPYSVDKTAGIVSVGRMKIFCLGIENPSSIFGYNLSAAIVDELDELPPPKALEAAQAISERVRNELPDGRAPFQVYSSTAQGFRGLWMLMEGLREKGIKRVMIRGETKSNIFLPRGFYERLYAQYSEIQRQVYLDGGFANLTAGRVYPSYDESKHQLKVPPFAIEPNDVIRIGQDLNSGYSRGAATVTRDGTIHVVKVFEFAEIAHAPAIIKAAFPSNPIEWYPDASAADIFQGYATSIRAAAISCRIGAINASVLDRIFFINKLFDLVKLVLWPGCGPLAMALKVRTFDDHGDPEKRQGPNDPSHYCDSLEYVVWRIVSRDPAFRFLWDVNRGRRKEISDKVVI